MSHGRPAFNILRGRFAPHLYPNTVRGVATRLTRLTPWHNPTLSRWPLSASRQYTTVHAADLSFGQPLSETHPHLLEPGELTPGITAQEYADRRTRLARKLPKGAVAVVAAADVVQRTGSCFYEFHQDPDFLYLTGFNEPEALAVIGQNASGADHTFHLYVREKDAKAEMWDGARSGTQAAVDVFNADETGDIASIKRTLPQVLADASHVYTDITQPDNGSSSLWRFLYGQTRRKTDFSELIDSRKIKQLRHTMNELRAYKSPAEIDLMMKAGRASGRAHTEALGQIFTTERDLDAFLRYKFVAHGCDTLAYEPVVAGGKNGLGIHYIRNDDMLHDDQMVLIDAAGKKGGYISDITRTWPVTGKFSAAQRDLYQAVLNVQKAMVSMCRGSANISLDKLHTVAEGLLSDQLKQIGFDTSSKAVETLFPHHISHYIGMDVHDTIGYSRKAVVREGHCITIEPGIYVPDDERWPKHFRNMAIRIEDSVSVGEDQPLVLTREAVKEIHEIEALRPTMISIKTHPTPSASMPDQKSKISDTDMSGDMCLDLGSILATGKYSDFRIKCDEHYFNVHKAVLCSAASFFKKAMEGNTTERERNEIDMQEDQPAIIARLLIFVYTGNYFMQPLAEWAHDGITPFANIQDPFHAAKSDWRVACLLAVALHKVADKLFINGLVWTSRGQFLTALRPDRDDKTEGRRFWSAKDMVDISIIVKSAYETTKEDDWKLHDPIVHRMLIGIGEFECVKWESYQLLLKEVPRLAFEIATSQLGGRRAATQCHRCRKRTPQRLWRCKCGQMESCNDNECITLRQIRSICDTCAVFGTCS